MVDGRRLACWVYGAADRARGRAFGAGVAAFVDVTVFWLVRMLPASTPSVISGDFSRQSTVGIVFP